MSEEKKNIAENKLTDNQVEQVSGGISRGGADTHNLLKDETEKQKSNGTKSGPYVSRLSR